MLLVDIIIRVDSRLQCVLYTVPISYRILFSIYINKWGTPLCVLFQLFSFSTNRDNSVKLTFTSGPNIVIYLSIGARGNRKSTILYIGVIVCECMYVSRGKRRERHETVAFEL